MFRYSRKPKDYVSSIDQLADQRSRDIVLQTHLDIDAIFPLCAWMNEEVSQHQRHLLIEVPDSDKDQALAQYTLGLASAAVVSYELFTRPSVSFPKPTSPQIQHVPRYILSELKRFSWQARRAGPPSHYEIMGRIFEDNLRNLEASIARGIVEINIDATYRKLYVAN